MSDSSAPAFAPGPAPEPAAGQRRSIYPFVIRATLGLLLVIILLQWYGIRAVAQTLEHEQPQWFAAAVALYLGGQVMSSYRWKLLGALVDLHSPWPDYLRYYFIGMFTNLFVPGLIGGDAARAAYLGLREKRTLAAAASVAADRGTGLAALFWLAAAILVLAKHPPLPPVLIRATIVIAGAGIFGLALAPYIARLLDRSASKRWRVVQLVSPYLRRPLALAPAILLSLVLQVSLIICQYWLALGMGISVSLRELAAIVPLVNVATSLPLTLNGLGIREGAYLLLLSSAGVTHQNAIALGLTWFAATGVGGLAGALPFLTTPLPSRGLSRSSGSVGSARSDHE